MSKCSPVFVILPLVGWLAGGPAAAGEADVMAVDARRDASGNYSFEVTVQHADSGWEHYANRWEVLTSDGKIIGTRVLHHPHVGEQPFTRSLSGLALPAGVKSVVVRAHDSEHEYGGAEYVVEIAGE